MLSNPYDRYKQQSVMTMTHGEMLVKLYEEVVKQLNNACHYIEQKDISATNLALQKSQRILNHLKSTLDFKYEVSAGLASLYDFFNQQIIAANIRKDADLLKEIIPLVAELKDTFAQGEKLARMNQQAAPSSISVGSNI